MIESSLAMRPRTAEGRPNSALCTMPASSALRPVQLQARSLSAANPDQQHREHVWHCLPSLQQGC